MNQGDFSSEEQIKSFIHACKQAFPEFSWRLYGGTNSINSWVEARIPGTYLDVSVGIWFDSNSAMATVSDDQRLQIFCSTQFKGQSVDEALTQLKSFLREYAQAILSSLGERHSRGEDE